jgi:hypothetical protein
LIYSNPENWEHPLFLHDPEFPAMPAERRAEMIEQSEALHRELIESGELIMVEGLADPASTRSVRVRNGVPVITDGPYSEAKEQLAGYLVVDCASLERATEIAGRIPVATVEVHPIMDLSGQER